MQETDALKSYGLTAEEVADSTVVGRKKQAEAEWNTLHQSISWFFFRHMPYILFLTIGFFFITLNMTTLLRHPERLYIANESQIKMLKNCIFGGIGISCVFYGSILLTMLTTRLSNLPSMWSRIASFVVRVVLFLLFTAPICYMLLIYINTLSFMQTGAFMITVYIFTMYIVTAGILSISNYLYKKLTRPTGISKKHINDVSDPSSNKGFLFYTLAFGLILVGSVGIFILPCLVNVYHMIMKTQGIQIIDKAYLKYISIA
ncbi:hypothetical protein NERG_01817 [Nematocida ausubeli]|uniref:Uncharacterized protein n=1 Tax=Nematocida ausubeli (strain ATCC PRA-371 / ERTm2) TaxID=1913371 RepID=H8ZDZ6_NEMA1|nr:hypothetical protein NERG_01817 [Nematocida ausubeli]